MAAPGAVDDRQRRLAAIMFTEMVGFTAMAQADEASALSILEDHNARLRRIFPRFHGREVKTMGDAFLVEFDSALEATTCAIEIQRSLREDGPAAPPFRLRIGIHLGDVVHAGKDVLGDAVNVASRMQPLADPGGVCISGQVYDQVRNKIAVRFEKLDPRSLKNVLVPVDVYRLKLPARGAAGSAPRAAPQRLAVLPFVNISADGKDEYFADGLTEELIGVLCQLRHLRVIAPGSVRQYKASSKDPAEIGAELGVASLLSGSVRTSGNRLRVNAQLIDVSTQESTSLGSYDRELGDVLALQAEIAQAVAGHLRLDLGASEEARLASRPVVRPESYLAYLKGRALLNDRSKEALRGAEAEFERAVTLDPLNAAALSGLADVMRLLGRYRHIAPELARERGRILATRAVEIDPNLAEAHASLGLVLHDDYRFGPAEQEFRLAVSLNPSNAVAHHSYALLLEDQGRAEEAERELGLAEEADPHSAVIGASQTALWIYLGQYDRAWQKLVTLSKTDPAGSLYESALALYYLHRADFTHLLPAIDRLNALRPGEPWILGHYAVYYATIGERARAKEILGKLEELPEGLRSESDLADVYAHLNELDELFVWLERGLERRDVNARYWVLDPMHAHVAKDPRFRLLLRKMNLA
ncbi:MAG: hypothetical protein L3K09_00350 [Thermoplasmata archaeon]|nr:hypothetical protein [Thermoplasmata archaeon]